jgi:hypothetical protein
MGYQALKKSVVCGGAAQDTHRIGAATSFVVSPYREPESPEMWYLLTNATRTEILFLPPTETRYAGK